MQHSNQSHQNPQYPASAVVGQPQMQYGQAPPNAYNYGGTQAGGQYGGPTPGPYGGPTPGPYGGPTPGPYGGPPLGPYGGPPPPGPYGQQPGPQGYGGTPGPQQSPYGSQPGPQSNPSYAVDKPGPDGPSAVGPAGDPVGLGEMPMGEIESAGPLQPSAPPISDMEKIQGYDNILSPNVTFVAPPPSYQEATSGSTGKSLDDVALAAKLTDTEARERLVDLAKSKCCWGKGAAQAMTIRNLEQSTAVHYVLKTFQEVRSTDWASEPFKGQMVDGPENGIAPAPWAIQIAAPPMFQDTVMKCEVPHTATVRVCHTCQGNTKVMCHRCRGWGRTRCSSCHGSGRTGMGDNRRSCTWCSGSGRRRCMTCHGYGRVPCPTCEAAGRVKCFVQLTVTFKTVVKDFILENTPLPDGLIRNVPGTTLFEDTQPLLNPIQSFSVQQVNTQSASIVQEHRSLALTGRIWMQNHVIRGVPVFQCDCAWKDKEFQFFVYGDNRTVYCANYPQTCCCGCEVL